MKELNTAPQSPRNVESLKDSIEMSLFLKLCEHFDRRLEDRIEVSIKNNQLLRINQMKEEIKLYV